MNIIVTGATGYLGTLLCAQLEKQGHTVVRLNSKNCDLTKSDSLLAFNQTRYDQIYHLAAWTQAGDFCLYHAGEQWLINQRINTNVLVWWQAHQPQAKLIAMGTSCAYDPDVALEEENYLVGKPIDSLFTYAMTKRMLYTGQLALHKQFGLKYLHVIPSTLYGPGYHTDERNMHFIFDVMRKILRAKKYGETVSLWGDGHQKRELVYIKDFVQALLQLSEHCENEIVNIGAGEEFSIREFAAHICRIVDYDANQIVYDTSKYTGAKSKCLSISKLKQLIPGYAQVSLEQGLATTVDWMQTHIKI